MKLLIFLVLPFVLLADTGTLVKVVDGDTLHFKTNNKIVKCRVQYIDTPESSDNAKNERDIANCKGVSAKDMASAGKSATRAAERLLTLKNEYSYEVNGKDRYGRSICVVKMGESTFNEQMILNGFAVPYRQYMNNTEKNYYNRLVSDARVRNSGLWKERQEVVECLNSVRN